MKRLFCPVCGAHAQATASGLVRGAQSYTARCPRCRIILHVRDWPNGTSDVSWVRPQKAVEVSPAEGPGQPGIPKPVRMAWEDDHMVALECECGWRSVYSAWVSVRTLAEEAIEHVRGYHAEEAIGPDS